MLSLEESMNFRICFYLNKIDRFSFQSLNMQRLININGINIFTKRSIIFTYISYLILQKYSTIYK